MVFKCRIVGGKGCYQPLPKNSIPGRELREADFSGMIAMYSFPFH